MPGVTRRIWTERVFALHPVTAPARRSRRSVFGRPRRLEFPDSGVRASVGRRRFAAAEPFRAHRAGVAGASHRQHFDLSRADGAHKFSTRRLGCGGLCFTACAERLWACLR